MDGIVNPLAGIVNTYIIRIENISTNMFCAIIGLAFLLPNARHAGRRAVNGQVASSCKPLRPLVLMKAEDVELEKKLRWIFEAYGKDLQSFFRDAYDAGLNVRPILPKYTHYCLRCGEGHNKAFGFCLAPDCTGEMGERKQALKTILKHYES